jgi:hypothetical protein
MTRSFLLTALVLALAACSELVPEAADSPVGPAVQMNQTDAGAAVAAALTVSTTCQSFRTELDDVNEQLAAKGEMPELQEKQAALTAIVADVCN